MSDRLYLVLPDPQAAAPVYVAGLGLPYPDLRTGVGIQGVLPTAQGGVPRGGTANQVLTKSSSADFSGAWADAGATSLRFVTNSTTAYTLLLADVDGNTMIRMTSTSANQLIFPPNASVAAPLGKAVLWEQAGAGPTTLTAGSTAVNLRSDSLVARTQYSPGGAIQTTTDDWLIFGDLA